MAPPYECKYVLDFKIPRPGRCLHWKMFVGLVLPSGGSLQEFRARFLKLLKSGDFKQEYWCQAKRLAGGHLRRPCPVAAECRPCLCLHCNEFICVRSQDFVRNHFTQTGHSIGYCMSTVFCFQCEDFVFEALIPGVSELPSGEIALVGRHLTINNPKFQLRGMANMGSTCFVNCIIQVLVHTPGMSNLIAVEEREVYRRPKRKRQGTTAPLRDKDKKEESSAKDVQGILSVFKELLREFQIKVEKPIAPTKLLAAIYEHIPHLAGHRQQDAHEFFISVLNSLHVELIHSNPTEKMKAEVPHEIESVIDQIFLGRLQSEVTCTICSHSRFTMDPFRGAALEIVQDDPADKTIDVNDLLSQFTRLEHLDESAELFCPCCNKGTVSTKQLSFKVLPPVICLQLKRFQHNSRYPNSNCFKKLKTAVKIPDVVNFSPFLSTCSSSVDVEKPVKGSCKKEIDSSIHYYLYAIVTHTGTFASGHYHTSIRKSSFWFNCNDETVKMISRDEALDTEGYLLFYKKANSMFE